MKLWIIYYKYRVMKTNTRPDIPYVKKLSYLILIKKNMYLATLFDIVYLANHQYIKSWNILQTIWVKGKLNFVNFKCPVIKLYTDKPFLIQNSHIHDICIRFSNPDLRYNVSLKSG